MLTKKFELCYSKLRMKINKKYVGWGMVVLVGIGLFWVMATVVVPRVMVAMVKAELVGKVSLANSYVVGEKITAIANGKDAGKISVFILDKNGNGVSGKTVMMQGEGSLGSKSGVSNKDGKVTAEFVSEVAGQYPVLALVGGSAMEKSVTLTFSKD